MIPPGVSVPLHSHPDTEDFIVIRGEVQALRRGTGGYEWTEVKAGDHVHVPGNARHAWRNVTGTPFVTYIITTAKLGKFFQEVGRPIGSTDRPVTAEGIAVKSSRACVRSRSRVETNIGPPQSPAVIAR